MDEEHDERKARDLIRARELSVRPRLAELLLRRLDRRRTRRPVGCTKRLFSKMGWEDPFADSDDDEFDAHRPVYVSGRFVRLDKAEQEERRRDPKAKVKRMQERKDEQRAEALRRAAQAVGSSLPEVPRGPPASQKADLDRRASMRAARGGPPEVEEIDRTPPAPAPPAAKRTTASGRFRAPPRRTGRKVVQGGEPPGGRAPIVVPDEVAPAADEPFSRGRLRQATHHTPRTVEGPQRPKVEVRRVAPDEPAPPAPEPTARPAAEPPPEPPPPPKPPPKPVERSPGKAAGSGGLDDLFGGMGSNEGRVRIGRRSRPTPKPDDEG